MQAHRIASGLSALNLVLFAALATRLVTHPALAQEPATDAAPALRARSLEIVDDQGRVRALLAVQPAVTVDGQDYPETVLLRLVDPVAGPVVKLTAAVNGSALSLSDDADGGMLLYARDTGTVVRLTDRDGRTSEIVP